jgi:hypothetical protein
MDGKQMPVSVVEFPAAFGTNQPVDTQRLFSVAGGWGGRLLEFSHDFRNRLGGYLFHGLRSFRSKPVCHSIVASLCFLYYNSSPIFIESLGDSANIQLIAGIWYIIASIGTSWNDDLQGMPAW